VTDPQETFEQQSEGEPRDGGALRPDEAPADTASGPADPQPPEDATGTASDTGPTALEDELATTRMALAELTADLQRLQAEYLNYKRRVDRDRDLVRENATYAVLAPMLDVLDDIDRARQHGELEGGFKGVAEKLERIVAQQGLTRFGAEGDAFDPTLHEALSHVGTDPDVSTVTCKHIAKAGYKIGDRVVRAAQVLVVDPAGDSPGEATPEAAGDVGDAGDAEDE
jgi:molecular chaperone GrpE